MKLGVKCSLCRARGQGLGGKKGTPGCRRPPVSRGKILPLTQRWHGGAPTWVHVGCSGARLGRFGDDVGPQNGIRGSQNKISELDKMFCDKVFQGCDLMATDCAQEVKVP